MLSSSSPVLLARIGINNLGLFAANSKGFGGFSTSIGCKNFLMGLTKQLLHKTKPRFQTLITISPKSSFTTSAFRLVLIICHSWNWLIFERVIKSQVTVVAQRMNFSGFQRRYNSAVGFMTM